MIAPEAGLSVSRQCTLLGIARSSFYYRPRPESAEELDLLKRLDRIFTDDPVYGSRRLQVALSREGVPVGRRRIRRLMRKLGLWAVRPKRNTSKPNPAPRVSVPGRNHRLGDATGVVLAAVEHAYGGVLRRGARRGARPVRQAQYLQYRPRLAVHQRRVHADAAGSRGRDQHGRARALPR